MRILSLIALALVAGGSAHAGDCLRVAPVVQGYSQGFTQNLSGDCGGAAQVVAPAYTYAPAQALVVRPVVQAQAYGYYQPQAVVVRQQVVQHAVVQRQFVQPVVVRQNVVVARQQQQFGGIVGAAQSLVGGVGGAVRSLLIGR